MTFKYKVHPEDFIVSEVINLYPQEKGEYSLYLLRKENLTTWEALGQIAKTLKLPLKYFGYGGLKDKKAVAFQYITIKDGPKRDLKSSNFELVYLGKVNKPLSKEHLLGNNFEIKVYDVDIPEDKILYELESIKNFGIPNYFDEQRFSSVGNHLKFAAKEIIQGNYEEALFLILAESSPDEITYSKKLRNCLRKNWRKWENCLKYARLKWEKELIKFLSQHKPSKRTFKRALHLVDQEYLFYLGNVYQSYLWNEVLKEILKYLEVGEFSIPFFLGEFYFYRKLSEEKLNLLKNLKIPFPSPKLNLEDTEEIPLKSLYLKVLNREGFQDLKELRSFIKGLIFKTYPRPAIVFPENLSCVRLSEKTYKLTFFLEKGSYATLVLKRIFYAP
ncbi:MAG: tRNA pseudouridine(13) synthase TruD [Caldimicrobium sp.]